MPKIMRLGGLTVSVSVALFALLAGCKTECKRGRTECVTDSLIRTCVPTANGNEWLISQCGASDSCSPTGAPGSGGSADAGGGSTAAKSDAGGGDGGVTGSASGLTAAPGVAACVGTCTSGDKECVSDALSKVCINGGVWSLNPCDVGKKCNSATGTCELSSGAGTVQACTAGAKACAGDKTEKVCNQDGTAWTQTACLLNMTCAKDHCVPDPKASCDNGPVCLDNKTAVRCLGTDKGYETVACKGSTYCEGGRCRGKVCAVGSVCSGTTSATKPSGTGIQECVDGTSYKNTACASNEVCQQDGDTATCVKQECVLGTVVCGDPRDSKVDKQKNFTVCEAAATFGGSAPNVPTWATGECAAPSTCSPAVASGQTTANSVNPCTTVCTPKEQRCATDPVTGIASGTQTCDANGLWGPVTTCNPGTAAALMCAPVYSTDASKLAKVVCTAPVCAYWLNQLAANRGVLRGVTTVLGSQLDDSGLTGNQGACKADQLLACSADGKLSASAVACAKGFCSNVLGGVQADGHTPGACPSPVTPECKDGEEICANGGQDGAFFKCVAGFWTAQLNTCTGSKTCFDTGTSSNNSRSIFCGDQCADGMRKCDASATPKLLTCTGGKWPTTGTACKSGACQSVVTGGVPDAVCALDCIPGELGCAGTSSQMKCNAKGTWDAPTACTTGTSCRVSGAGRALGCVECVGTAVKGGNENGVSDTQCDPTSPTKLRKCGDNNKYAAGTSCTNTCVQGSTSDTCGSCQGIGGTTLTQCTNSTIASEPACGPCTVYDTNVGGAVATLTHCTNTAIAAAGSTITESCTTQNYGTVTTVNGSCCSFYVTTAAAVYGSTSTPGSASCLGQGLGAPSYFAGYANCCATEQIHASPYAYCQ